VKRARIIIIFTFCFYISGVVFAAGLDESKVDMSPLIEMGCKRVKTYPGESSLDCSSIGLEKKFGCEQLTEVPNELGALTPSVPIIECWFSANIAPDAVNGIRIVGCMLPETFQYLVYTKGEFVKIDSPKAFVSFFAPVGSPEEALAFAVALSDGFPIYKIEIPEGMYVETPNMNPTSVEKSGDNFLVHLFGFDSCGCGPHWYYSIPATVNKAGDVSVGSRKNYYHNPKDEELCWD
jgi:hypothetical protein